MEEELVLGTVGQGVPGGRAGDEAHLELAAGGDLLAVLARVEVHPIDDLRGFAEHRLGKAGLAADKLFAPDAFDALRLKLSGPKERTSGEGASLLYPLVVGNTLIAGLNMAAALGVDKVSADIINRV